MDAGTNDTHAIHVPLLTAYLHSFRLPAELVLGKKAAYTSREKFAFEDALPVKTRQDPARDAVSAVSGGRHLSRLSPQQQKSNHPTRFLFINRSS